MKNNILLSGAIALIILLQYGCGVKKDFAQLRPLLGKWDATQLKVGTSAFEHWERNGRYEMEGLGVRLGNGERKFEERMRLLIKNGHIYYGAFTPQNQRWVDFKMTAIDGKGFTVHNPDHDFPTTIRYEWSDPDQLMVTISGGGRSIPFYFAKAQ